MNRRSDRARRSDDLREEPLLLTVDEAAEILRIGRTLAYGMARQYEASSGRDGLPVMRMGRCLRVPRWALLELARCGRVVRLTEEINDRAGADGRVGDQLSAGAVSGTAGGRGGRLRSSAGVRPSEQLVLIPSVDG